jgi:hypothetical protein
MDSRVRGNDYFYKIEIVFCLRCPTDQQPANSPMSPSEVKGLFVHGNAPRLRSGTSGVLSPVSAHNQHIACLYQPRSGSGSIAIQPAGVRRSSGWKRAL